MKMNRKSFLKVLGTTVGGTLFLPKFLYALPTANYQSASHLVILQLNGGNDGLNTFIPYTDPLYYENRPNIGIAKENILKLNNTMGFHPACKGFLDLMDSGNMSILQNIGYPNPNRSHFRSIEIWQTASKTEDYLTEGWLGRYLDATCSGEEDSPCAINFDTYDNIALKANKANTITMKNPSQFEKMVQRTGDVHTDHEDNPNLEFVKKLAVGAIEGHEAIERAFKKASLATHYPTTEVSKNLSYIARLIKGSLATKVYYTSLGGFDTHANQLNTHKNKLQDVSEAVKAFFDDLKNANLHQDVTLLIFSEFGRRVKENGKGTDHGTAAPVFIVGGNNKNTIIGKNPNLADLDANGDLKFEIDFRSVYATLLTKKLGVDPQNIGIREKMIQGLF